MNMQSFLPFCLFFCFYVRSPILISLLERWRWSNSLFLIVLSFSYVSNCTFMNFSTCTYGGCKNCLKLSLTFLFAKLNLTSIGKKGICCRLKKWRVLCWRMSTYVMCKRNTFHDMQSLLWICIQYFCQGLIVDCMLRLYVALHQLGRVSKYTHH